jgi:D-3-phosphoglycerate dehydrogenase
MMDKRRVLYYNIDDNLDYENMLLKEWSIDNLELVEVKDKEGSKSFVEYAYDFDGVVVEYQQITEDIINSLPNLKIVTLQSIGYNNVDIDAATRKGVCVTNIPGFCTEEVALHTVGMIIDLVRKITFLDRSVRKGKWNPLYGYKTYRLTGKIAGLYFFGSIPKAMTPVLKALGLNILVYAPTKTKEYLMEYGVEKVDTFEELLTRSDFVSLHCPLMESTTHLISERELELMKDTAYLINTARGKVVDEKALVKALESGKIKGAAVDVIEDEEAEQSELFKLENTIITPHAAFVSEDSFYEGRKRSLKQLVLRLSKNKSPEYLVNNNLKITL